MCRAHHDRHRKGAGHVHHDIHQSPGTRKTCTNLSLTPFRNLSLASDISPAALRRRTSAWLSAAIAALHQVKFGDSLARHVQIARFHSAAARSADWTPNSIAFIIRRSSPNRKKDTAGRMTVGVRQTINACMHFQLVRACLHSTMQERA